MDDKHKENLQRWDYLANIHADSDYYDINAFKQGKSSLYSIEKEELPDLKGKTVLHLQCHFGMDTLSLARMGAIVTGVDYSSQAINKARQLASELGLQATFVCSDIKSLNLDTTFDFIFTSYGVLCWLDELDSWGRTIYNHLKAGGQFYIVENHPIINIFYNEDDASDFKVSYPYFIKEALEFETEGSYASRDESIKFTTYQWNHSLGEVISQLTRNGLFLEWLHEHDRASWMIFPFMKKEGEMYTLDHKYNIPLSFSLLATKR
ncbi:MAG: class I SAM-dependent methyltransferase [Candidatus Heimdallarchaeota archaeon]|nr:class I SAM-dependent methyltransferase [Candidatus Heimdallarchaeota archaeon]